jgi:hypothetical protein
MNAGIAAATIGGYKLIEAIAHTSFYSKNIIFYYREYQ